MSWTLKPIALGLTLIISASSTWILVSHLRQQTTLPPSNIVVPKVPTSSSSTAFHPNTTVPVATSQRKKRKLRASRKVTKPSAKELKCWPGLNLPRCAKQW